ncbi:hypothetical protein A4L_25 [Anabaena phage A-4L]|uniref:Uncharacterized protein n=1 Tax=Anabaena phage A-4L TaxID=1357732 RepID=A0A059PYA7_9CAUD|nr:hypothetical protein A4L_25 [Anabaena phage A-4L]AGR48552.1 hypothetical protein A4L_25 [Anabaena phage A-4L]
MSIAWYRELYGTEPNFNYPNGVLVPNHPGYNQTPGGIYLPNVAALSGAAITANRIHYVYFQVAQTFVTDALVFRVSTAVTGNARVGLYTVDPSSGFPQFLVTQGSAAALTGGSTGDRVVLINRGIVTLPPTWYMTAIVSDVAANLAGINGSATAQYYRQPSIPSGGSGCYTAPFTYGVLPDLAPTPDAVSTTNHPVVGLRTA